MPKNKSATDPQDITVFDTADAYVPIPMESVPPDTTLAMDIYLRIAENFVRFRVKGDKLTSRRQETLKGQYSDCIYVTRESWKNYLEGLETSVADIGETPSFNPDSVNKMRHLLVAYGKQLENGKEINRKTFDKVRKVTKKIAMAVRQDILHAQRLVRHYNDPAMYATNHALNVCAYSCAIGTKLLLSHAELQNLALAAFLHDIGKVYIDKETLAKGADATEDEIEEIQSHTAQGALLLASMYPMVPQAALVAAQHHERIDGSGFPSRLNGKNIHLFSKIVKIADVFDFLTSLSPAVDMPLDPVTAIEAMKCMTGKFDKQVFGTFQAISKPKGTEPNLLSFATSLKDADKSKKAK